MKKKEKNSIELKEELFSRYPTLEFCRSDFELAYKELKKCYDNGGKMLIAGNGGSASDSEHVVSELMKSFLFNRKINKHFENNLISLFNNEGALLADRLEGVLPAISLTSMNALATAFANDVDAVFLYAQLVYGIGEEKDIFFGISTSGNSKNVEYALMSAKAKRITTIALTGKKGGKCAEIADIAIRVPENETFKIQEYHLPIYHALCAMLEADFFEEK